MGGVTIDGLFNGRQYQAVVAAIDPTGRVGPASPPSPAVTPTTNRAIPPGPVVGLSARPVNGGVTLLWNPPVSDGGSLVQGYRVLASPGNRTIDTPWGVHAITFGDLDAATPYSFSVVALTDAGYSDAVTSAPLRTARVGAARPDPTSAPTINVAADGTWKATFVSGGNVGGNIVRKVAFTVVPTPNDGTASVAVSPEIDPPRGGNTTTVVVQGGTLAPAVQYTFTVVAWNGYAAAVSVPSAPTGRPSNPDAPATTAGPTPAPGVTPTPAAPAQPPPPQPATPVPASPPSPAPQYLSAPLSDRRSA